jgi:hypothetical protein
VVVHVLRGDAVVAAGEFVTPRLLSLPKVVRVTLLVMQIDAILAAHERWRAATNRRLSELGRR